MRIISGRWAGRDLESPGGRVRPTAEAVRAAWMDRLEPDLDGARLLDLFAGTGALGLEALSRGADRCDFVENGPSAMHALKANVARFRLKGRTRVFRRDARTFHQTLEEGSYDICLADPPYTSSLARALILHWADRRFARIIAVESDADTVMPRAPRGAKRDRFTFDGSAVTIYR